MLGQVNSGGHNLDSGSSCNFTKPGDLSNRNPLLGPLQDNGGRTPTLALQAGSPAIDAGDLIGCPATDQRGVLRPQHGQCDIGAFEAEFAFASGSFAISPPSGPYARTQHFDAVLFVNALGKSITQTQATFDGVDQSGALNACVIPGTLATRRRDLPLPGSRRRVLLARHSHLQRDGLAQRRLDDVRHRPVGDPREHRAVDSEASSALSEPPGDRGRR